ncbi:MAG: restriction endonuclease subunit R [Phycisphaerae bacterium]|nr:restriction endonuclease subunit R [Phycisphaerae bacterium]
MAAIPKKVSERLAKNVGKFQNVLQIAKDRDLNESDTVAIINDMLGEVFGYDKYLEITSEFAVRGTYCDLAVKIDSKIQFLIEVKAVGIDLKENHLRQVVDYGANYGVQWVVLTNGVIWEIYRIRFEQPINYDLVCSINLLTLSPRKAEDQERLFILCKEGLSKDVRGEFYERVQVLNRFTLAALVLSDPVVDVLRRELRKLAPGLKVDQSEISKILLNEVLKRDATEGEEAAKVKARIKKSLGKALPKQKPSPTADNDSPIEKPAGSFSDRLLRQAGTSPVQADGGSQP